MLQRNSDGGIIPSRLPPLNWYSVHPLLFREHSMPDCRHKIRDLLGGSDETFKSIKRQIKKCQTPEVGRGPKRGKEICEWMWEDEGVSR